MDWTCNFSIFNQETIVNENQLVEIWWWSMWNFLAFLKVSSSVCLTAVHNMVIQKIFNWARANRKIPNWSKMVPNLHLTNLKLKSYEEYPMSWRYFIDRIDLIYGIIKKLRFCKNTPKMKWMTILRQKTKTFQFNQNVTLKRQEVFTFSEWEKG